MNRLCLSLFARIGCAVLSLGLGMASYQLFHRDGANDSANESGQRSALPPRTEIVLDAEAHLLVKAVAPVDAAGDALGIYYILQADGAVLRSAPEIDGGHASTVYAELADGRTETSLGFSGFVLHPDFLARGKPGCGRFYVVVAEKAGAGEIDFLPEFGAGEHHQDVLYEYCVEDPLLAEFRGTRRELMRFRQPGSEHNVRGLAFDPSGSLYLGVGDGALGEIGHGSPSRNASSLANAYGKVLRVDPLGSDAANGQYGIPDGNPFRLVTGALPELWAFGLRAPSSLSYDPFQRRLCIAEQARPDREEINLSFRGGEHFGWDIGENPEKLPRSARARLAEVVTAPTVSLDLAAGWPARTSGSVVYRGESFPSLAGALLFASRDGQLLALRAEQGAAGDGVSGLARVDLGRFSERRFSALRSGPRGELLFLCEDGQVFEMRKGASLGTGGVEQRSLFCEVGGALGSQG